MNTSNDYLFALQLQNENFPENKDDFNVIGPTESTKSTSATDFKTIVIDLTDEVDETRHKRNRVNNSLEPIKRQRLQTMEATASVVDHSWETIDPNPDIHGLFLAFNQQYFWSSLDMVTVQWSNRMTVCAGLCRYEKGFCSIGLSVPLLKLRPRKDLVETLLHEMIHAYLFITNKDHLDRDGHGSEFCKHMYRINVKAGTKISIYHNFHEEVKLYKQHWWKCNGPCQKNKPFYGYVKRSMNRAPGPNDKWWANHQAICSGIFIKVKEPEGYGMKKKAVAQSISKPSTKPKNKITNFIKVLDSSTKKCPEKNNAISSTSTESVNKQEIPQKNINLKNLDETMLCPVCNESIFTEWLNDHLQNCSQLKEMFGNEINNKCKCPACSVMVDRSLMNEHLDDCKMLNSVFENDESVVILDDANYVNCPNCNKVVKDNNINEHLDICLLEESPKPRSVKNKIICSYCKKIFTSVIELDNHIDNCL